MVWMFYCLIISKGYQGVLRSFMIVPVRTKPINQLSEILESGLEWEMISYGAVDETTMATSANPVIRQGIIRHSKMSTALDFGLSCQKSADFA